VAGLGAILDELANSVRTAIDGIDWDIQVEPWFVINPSPITVDIFPAEPPSNDETMGFGELEGSRLFTVRARTNTPDVGATRDVLLALMDIEDEHSIHVSITDDQTLNGLATQVIVTGGTGLSVFPTPDGLSGYLGVQWTVEVMDVRS
jgi:hypothetical protein